ncbi:MAG: hypothetical protein H7Y03_15280 [Chitinophagaceae bacterium]|nr:hypothetical protein [Chitinophagaceae bacterium]
MKRILLTSLLSFAVFGLLAQNIEKAKDMLKDKKLQDAKNQIDKALANEKNAKSSDAWYTKAKIYNEIANDSILKATVPDAREQAFEAIQKYVQTDEKSQLLQLTLEQYRPIMDIYSGYYKVGASFYNSNNFNDAFINFKRCLDVSDYMISKKWSNLTMDTSIILYTGISADKINSKDTAARYYRILADAKVGGKEMDLIYKWLADYYNQKKDVSNAEKYLKIGAELYPEDTYWSSMELEMAGSNTDRNTLYKKYDEIMVKEPTNYIYPYNYGVELYKEAYVEDITKRPADSKEKIAKAEQMIKKSLELKPDYFQAGLVLGQIYYNQAVDISTQSRSIKAGANGKISADDQKKKDAFRAEMIKKFDAAIPYLESVEKNLGSAGKLKMDQKTSLKNAYDLLATIYDNKQNKEKLKEYEEKFNNVDKAH